METAHEPAITILISHREGTQTTPTTAGQPRRDVDVSRPEPSGASETIPHTPAPPAPGMRSRVLKPESQPEATGQAPTILQGWSGLSEEAQRRVHFWVPLIRAKEPDITQVSDILERSYYYESKIARDFGPQLRKKLIAEYEDELRKLHDLETLFVDRGYAPPAPGGWRPFRRRSGVAPALRSPEYQAALKKTQIAATLHLAARIQGYSSAFVELTANIEQLVNLFGSVNELLIFLNLSIPAVLVAVLPELLDERSVSQMTYSITPSGRVEQAFHEHAAAERRPVAQSMTAPKDEGGLLRVVTSSPLALAVVLMLVAFYYIVQEFNSSNTTRNAVYKSLLEHQVNMLNAANEHHKILLADIASAREKETSFIKTFLNDNQERFGILMKEMSTYLKPVADYQLNILKDDREHFYRVVKEMNASSVVKPMHENAIQSDSAVNVTPGRRSNRRSPVK